MADPSAGSSADVTARTGASRTGTRAHHRGLMDAGVIITGLSSEVARTLVTIGRDGDD